jgi:hypothetical protein
MGLHPGFGRIPFLISTICARRRGFSGSWIGFTAGEAKRKISFPPRSRNGIIRLLGLSQSSSTFRGQGLNSSCLAPDIFFLRFSVRAFLVFDLAELHSQPMAFVVLALHVAIFFAFRFELTLTAKSIVIEQRAAPVAFLIFLAHLKIIVSRLEQKSKRMF